MEYTVGSIVEVMRPDMNLPGKGEDKMLGVVASVTDYTGLAVSLKELEDSAVILNPFPGMESGRFIVVSPYDYDRVGRWTEEKAYRLLVIATTNKPGLYVKPFLYQFNDKVVCLKNGNTYQIQQVDYHGSKGQRINKKRGRYYSIKGLLFSLHHPTLRGFTVTLQELLTQYTLAD